MARCSIQLLCLVVAFAAVAEARSLKGPKDGDSNLKAIQVDKTLKAQTPPKGYVGDKKPKVDVLHFKHPYPVVQDNGEFDKDFVKDENSDDGSYMAQHTYDMLRHKLAKQKKEVEEASKKKQKEEKELAETTREFKSEIGADKADIAKKQAELAKRMADAKKADQEADAKMDKLQKKLKQHKADLEEAQKQSQVKPPAPHKAEVEPEPEPEPKHAEKKEPKAKEWSACDYWPFPWGCTEPKMPEMPKAPKVTIPTIQNPFKADSGVSKAQEGVAQAKKQFGECQKELAAAKEELKQLMESLEKAKREETDAYNEKVAELTTQSKHMQEEIPLHKEFDKESKEYNTAKKAFEKQQERVDKLKRDLEAARVAVKGQRDSEDADGGVYNTPQSFASVVAAPSLLAFAAAVAAAW